MIIKVLISLFISTAILMTTAAAQTTNQPDNPEADRAAIRAHIESICQAFIDNDIEKIYATHSEDWRGFLENSRVPIRGINEYMKANGITYPVPANAVKPPPPPANAPTVTFKVFDFDVNFYSPELAVASFMLDFGRKSGDSFTTLNRLRIMDVYAKRSGGWIQVASHTVVDPAWRWEQISKPATNFPPQLRQQLLDAREAVWRAWFANDRAKLEELIPEEALAGGAGGWQNRAAILEDSKKFAETGAKLVRLEFPRTEMQIYGNTIILYTSYLIETEKDGRKNTSTGNGVETFVRRGGKYVNTGWLLAEKK